MVSRLIPALALVLILTGCNAMAGERVPYSAKAYFKNYALSTCIADAFDASDVSTAAAAAARGYLELGDYPLEAHTEATLLGREFLKRDYVSKSGANLALMKCIDFFHSPALEALAEKYAGK
ncbi:T6SS amidase immunity protein Tai4 family protein [Denitromonas halophila]|uniref:Type VI secretion protein n=1 Tax=Denitromonas halophila TaxID=1629404 RepID=A0A557QFB7_9RHOO|nr:T6SS amidase immunity protein Tai4 family protein [Denitromonas halophila]TVO51584.1 type VI secretion protein [Denitromonas halophila]